MTSRRGWTARLSSPRDADFESDAACIFAVAGTEERARLPFWNDRMLRLPESCSEVDMQGADHFRVTSREGDKEIALRDSTGLRDLFLGRERVYLDISGLGHHVWAPVLREGLRSLRTLWVVYAEPERYRPHPSPASATTYDLSTSLGEVSPLPGFAKLRGPDDEGRSLFVPLLGFEGARAPLVAMSLDPVPRVIPVVGVPGFRLEYPFVTIACNQEFLDDYRSHADVRLARASCPFEAYSALADIRKDNPDSYMYLAPIGTKPHALGAIWYAIENPGFTEIIYDHPVRRPQRTYGIGTVHVYCLKDEV